MKNKWMISALALSVSLTALAPSSVFANETDNINASSYSIPEGQIQDQSFETTLDGFGTVTFASFSPETTENGDGDARFRLLSNGDVIYDFPGVTEDNIRPGQTFSQIAAVSFQDYNEDGQTDIIVIITYTSQKNPGEKFDEVRLYTQSQINREFSLDNPIMASALSRRWRDLHAQFFLDNTLMEYLVGTNQQHNVTSVLNGIAAYQKEHPAKSISEEERKQLQVIANNRELWYGPSEFQETYLYAVTDLNQDGRLELIRSSCQGTGLYTYSTYFEVNESLDGLTSLNQLLEEGSSEADIMVSTVPVYYDSENDTYYYIFDDVIRNGSAEYYENKRALSLEADAIQNTMLAYRSVISSGGSDAVITCQNADETKISEAAYESIADTVFPDLEKKTASLSWQPGMDYTDISPMTDEEVLKMLLESYAGFHIS